ncbi:MAG: S1 RNA-binding domain-containing protein [Butyricicoccus sp.]
MKTSESYLPEGSYMVQPAVRQAFSTLGALRQAQDEGRILEAVAQRCTAAHDLLFDLGIAQGILPRVSCALGVAEGDTREIAILSRVGKPTCFVVTDIDESTDPPTAWLSRTIVQQKAQDRLLDSLRPGDVIPARVTHLEPFGAFVDAGCGVPSLIGIENLSVSRICHPGDRLTVGQSILAAVRTVEPENRRISLTHRELLGTWAQNAALFSPGETVRRCPLHRAVRRVHRAYTQPVRSRGAARGPAARHGGIRVHQVHPAAADEGKADRHRRSRAV